MHENWFEYSPFEWKPDEEIANVCELIKSDSISWNTGDYDRINEARLVLIDLKKKRNEIRTMSDANVEKCRPVAFRYFRGKGRISDGKQITEKQAEYLAKYEANKYMNPQAHINYWYLVDIVKFLEDRMIQIWIINKDQRSVEQSIYLSKP